MSAVLLVLVNWLISCPRLVRRGPSLPADPADSSQMMHIQVGLALGSGVAVAERSIVPGLVEAPSTGLDYSSRPLVSRKVTCYK
jgi:hypothetical protein